MAQLIGCLLAMYLCIYLPWKANKKKESRKRQDMYNNVYQITPYLWTEKADKKKDETAE